MRPFCSVRKSAKRFKMGVTINGVAMESNSDEGKGGAIESYL